MKRSSGFQGQAKLESLSKEFPFLPAIRGYWSKRGRLPKTKVSVQIADLETMRLQARNCGFNGHRAYLDWHEKEWRGKRLQCVMALGRDGRIIKKMFWAGTLRTVLLRKLRDIFKTVPSDQVKYLAWVTYVEWWSAPTQEMRERDLSFGTERKSREMSIIIFREPKGLSFGDLAEISLQEDRTEASAYRRFPRYRPSFPAIQMALKKGYRMHAFLSGGGLRVVRLDRSGKSLAYGEHPHIEEALAHLEADVIAGGRKYEDVYGKMHPHYLTGSTNPSSNLDAWIRGGSTFDCWREGEEVVFQLSGYHQDSIPKEVCDFVRTTGMSKIWQDGRGFEFCSEPSQIGRPGMVSTSVVAVPVGRNSNDAWMYHITKTGRAKTFWPAVMKAFRAPEAEVKKEKKEAVNG